MMEILLFLCYPDVEGKWGAAFIRQIKIFSKFMFFCHKAKVPLSNKTGGKNL